MENPVQAVARLLGALGSLIDQEGMYLRGGSYDLAVQVRERSEPLVQQLVTWSALPEVRNFQPQVADLVERSAIHSKLLQEKIDGLRTEMKRTEQARNHAAQFAPAYCRTPAAVLPRFSAAG